MENLDDKRKQISNEWKEIAKMAKDDAKNESEELRNTLTIIFGGAGVGAAVVAASNISNITQNIMIFTAATSSFAGLYFHMRNKAIYNQLAKYASNQFQKVSKEDNDFNAKLPNYDNLLKAHTVSFNERIFLTPAFIIRSAMVSAVIYAGATLVNDNNEVDAIIRNNEEKTQSNLNQELVISAP